MTGAGVGQGLPVSEYLARALGNRPLRGPHPCNWQTFKVGPLYAGHPAYTGACTGAVWEPPKPHFL